MDNFWHGKKVVAYVALLHHTRFIIPVMERLSRLGAHVEYIIALAERSQEITAITSNLNYTHVFDYLTREDLPDIQENYIRIRNAFVHSLEKNYILGSQILTVTDKTIYAEAQEYVGFRNFLRIRKPDICFALHEVNRWGKTFAFWAKKFNIPFITLQEGLGYDEDYGYTGHVQYATLDLVWGDRIRKKLGHFEAPIERIIPVGNTHLSGEIRRQKKEKIREKTRKKLKLGKQFVPLLLFSAFPPVIKLLMPLFEAVADCSHLKLIIKFHPATTFQTHETFCNAIPQKYKKKLILVQGEENTYDLMSASDLCVLAQPSTTGIEAVALGKPLVQLDLGVKKKYPYSFVNQNVALAMTVKELSRALTEKKNFSDCFAPEDIRRFFKNELTEAEGATDRIIRIMEQVIVSSRSRTIRPLPHCCKSKKSETGCKWTLVLPVPREGSMAFLTQINAIAQHSENQGEYEAFIVEPESKSAGIVKVLDSLQGDLTRVTIPDDSNFFDTVNRLVVPASQGKFLAIFSLGLCPGPDWLAQAQKGIDTHGPTMLFGAKIANRFNNIIHAGMVLNANNAPVSAYLHLDTKFPAANKERPFQMMDHFLLLSKKQFIDLGGFSPETRDNAFMDLCLKAGMLRKEKACIFLPRMEFTKDTVTRTCDPEAAIQFYARWHDQLWDSEDALYNQDGVSKLQLEAARMTRALSLANAR